MRLGILIKSNVYINIFVHIIFIMITPLLCLLLLTLFCQIRGKEINVIGADGTDYKIELTGGMIKMRTFGLNTTDRSIMIKWDRIEELDSSGTILQYAKRLDTQSFDWVGPSEVSVTQASGITVDSTQFSLTSDLNVGQTGTAKFGVVVHIFNQDVLIANGATTVTARKGAVKFTLHFEQWPWTSTGVALKFGAELKGKGGTSGVVKRKNDNTKVVSLGVDGSLETSTIARSTIGSLTTDVNVNTTNWIEGNKAGVSWLFPRFDSLDYDPVLSSESNNASIIQPIHSILLVLIVITMITI